jgi:hypothetical protein
MEIALFTLRFINNKVTTSIKALYHLHFVTCIEDMYVHIYISYPHNIKFFRIASCVCVLDRAFKANLLLSLVSLSVGRNF